MNSLRRQTATFYFSSLDATPLKIHGGLGIMMENDGYRVLLTMHTQK